jgi:hypothetical protein
LITAALKHKGGRVRRPAGVTGEQQQHCGCVCKREFGDEKARYGALAPLRGTAYKAVRGMDGDPPRRTSTQDHGA